MADDNELDAEIEQQVGEWSSDSNDCFHITLLRSDGTKHTTFSPKFTYPMFGEQEAIFGYVGLSIDLTFAAYNLQPRLQVSWERAFKEQGDIKPTDINTALTDFVPAEAFTDTSISFEDAQTFVPPGEVIRTYNRESEAFEVRCASLADPAAKQLLERMQILVPLFIEGGSMLQLEQEWTAERWKLFTLWTVITDGSGKKEHALIGYGTSYRIFTLPDRHTPAQSEAMDGVTTEEPDFPPFTRGGAVQSPLDLLSRERLSQFLILPGFQSKGHGQELYRAMYSCLTAPDNVREFTVEDPNEDFDDMRDFCDLTWLRGKYPEFSALEINADIPTELLATSKEVPVDAIVPKSIKNKIRKESKIIDRQFDRMVEMHTLSRIPRPNRSPARITRREKTSNENDRKYYFWRMLVKQRAMIFNHDALVQLDPSERAEKLEAVVDSNQGQYTEIIEKVLERENTGLDLDGAVSSSNGTKVIRKRKVIDDDDDEDMETVSNTSKRPKAA